MDEWVQRLAELRLRCHLRHPDFSGCYLY